MFGSLRRFAEIILPPICALLLLCDLSVAQKAFAAEPYHPFATFNVDLDIDIEDGEIEAMGNFTLASASNGIDPAKEPVSLHVSGGTASYSVAIPAGSFKGASAGVLRFQGTVAGVKLSASIRPLRSGAFEFQLVTERAKLNGMSNPTAISFTVGDDGGSRSVKAKIE